MAKIGRGLVKKQKSNRDSKGFITPDKVFDIKKHGQDWHRFEKNTRHQINILPFQIRSEKDLAFKMKGDFHREVGEWVYSLNYWVHPRIHGQKDVLCLKKCFGMECPICDKADEKWDIYNADKSDDNKKAANALSPKLRSMYNLEVLTDKLKGKNSFYEASDYIFEDPLIERATDCEEGEEPVAFYEIDAEEGKIVKFKTAEIQRDPCKLFDFKDRTKPISKSLLEGVLYFGELVPIPTFDEVNDFFYGADFAETPEDDDEDEGQEEEEEYSEPEEEEAYEEEEETSAEPEEEEEKLSPTQMKAAMKEKSGSGGKWEKCPSKKKFGLEFGDFDDCDACPVSTDCHKAYTAAQE